MPQKKTSKKSAKKKTARKNTPNKKGTESLVVGPCEHLPGSLRELARLVLAQRDPVAFACKLLDGSSDSVKARTYENLSSWAYGKPPGKSDGTSASPTVRIICDIPRPSYETAESE
jgi:hypothetical protein